ncbi:hypothetical protein [Georgenia subflava]|uniref:Uncharacterized protein n=1 Tax=Georgenia subflava TaxID=1622177 RepID=A0A6N7EHF8_9MICO|nr:hypothetical protein [Georgenia subflava]MPV37569.1 hypothetical protein [Georgenia subflava]
MAHRTPPARTFVVLAVISGSVIAASVLAWVMHLIPFEVFIGVVGLVVVVEAIVILRTVSRVRAEAADRRVAGSESPARADRDPDTDVNTLGASGADELGYDPMAKFRPPND